MVSFQFLLEISRATFNFLGTHFILSMLIVICCAVSFVSGDGIRFVALNEFGFCFVLSKERKPPDKVELLNLNSIGSKLIVVFAAILLMTSYLGLMIDNNSIILSSQVDSVPSFHSLI